MQTAERTRFTEAEMATVRDTDLPDLLSSLGYQVKRIGRYYTTQEMDSIRIKDRRTWFRYSEGIGGDAITFLQRFYNKSFPEAVEYLLTWHGRARDSPSVSTPRQTKEKEEKVPFTLPPANVDHRRVFAYLRKRGIAPQVIRGFVEAGLLYEDAQHHNCVFVGRDQSGAPVFANQRGTYDWNSSSFKGDVPGSNKDIYIPDSYDGSESYALFLTLPGYEGLYFQGVGQNLYSENFAFEALNYNDRMIVAAPQLSDWGETSAVQTIALTEYLLDRYNIDRERVYAEGYSVGGETLSRVMGMRPDLFTAYLQCSSQWDGAYEPVAEARVPVYFVIGEGDEYYSAEPSREAYNRLHDLYTEAGLTEEEISRLLVLDVKDSDYFREGGAPSQHGGGNLFAGDSEIMGWLFSQG